MLYDVQKVERDKWGTPVLRTDLVTSSKRRIFNRVWELQGRKQQNRVIDQDGRIMQPEDIHEMR
jgi:hypothetical protein